MDEDIKAFLEKLSDRISDWHSNCNCYECSDMIKAMIEIDDLITSRSSGLTPLN